MRNRSNEGAAYIAEGWYLWRHRFTPIANDSRTKLAIRTAKHVYLATHLHSKAGENFKKAHPNNWRNLLEEKLKKLYAALISNLKTGPGYDNLDEVVEQPAY